MRLISIATLAVGALVVGTPATAQPSFDCTAQLNATEQAICRDAGLARLDRHMASTFYVLYEKIERDRAPKFRADQTQWRRDRDACGSAVGCIRNNYIYRIGIFEEIIGGDPSEGLTEITRSPSARVLPDGTIEKRNEDGSITRHLPNGRTERVSPDGEQITVYTQYSQVPYANLPPLPPTHDGWATSLEGSLLIILDNILTDDEYTAYQSTETGKDDYVLIDWRLRSISILTQP